MHILFIAIKKDHDQLETNITWNVMSARDKPFSMHMILTITHITTATGPHYGLCTDL